MADPDITAERIREGMALERAGRLQDAADIYLALTDENPKNAEGWHRLGQVTTNQLNPSGGLSYIERAVELEPQNSRFRSSLGSTLGHLGQIETAKFHLQEAIRLDPNNVVAYYNLSRIIRFTRPDPFIKQVEDLLKRSKGALDRIVLHFAAGKYYDDVGSYDRAFFHYQNANAAKSSQFSPERYWRYVQALFETFDADFVRARFGNGCASDLPIFVIGMPRSGTSLVEQILSSHSSVFGADELTDIKAISEALQKHSATRKPYPYSLRDVSDTVIRGYAELYLARLRELAPTARYVVNKMPMNFEHLGLIALMFPKARVIHCTRDKIDTCLSCYFQNFSNKNLDFSCDLFHLRIFWDFYQRLMNHWSAVLPIKMLEVAYEELVTDQDKWTRAMLDFCGLDWEPGCEAPHLDERPVQSASLWQVRQPVYERSIGRWKNYERHIGPLLDGPQL